MAIAGSPDRNISPKLSADTVTQTNNATSMRLEIKESMGLSINRGRTVGSGPPGPVPLEGSAYFQLAAHQRANSSGCGVKFRSLDSP